MKVFWLVVRRSVWLFFRYLFPYGLFIGVIGGLGVGAYMVSASFVRVISQMSADLRAVLLAGLATPIVAILSVVITHYLSRRREIDAALRASKIEFYEGFLEEYFDLLVELTEKQAGGAKRKALPDLHRRMVALMASTARNLMLWGGKETVKAFLALRDQASRGPEGETGKGIPVILQRFEDLITAIRHELGHSRYGLSRGDLLRLFINDIDEYLAR